MEFAIQPILGISQPFFVKQKAGPTGIEPAAYGLRVGHQGFLIPSLERDSLHVIRQLEKNPNAIISYSNKPELGLFSNCGFSTVGIVVGNGFGAVNWQDFSEWLLGRGLSRKHVKDVILYAKRYGQCLFTGRLNEIEGCGRRHVMASLANLSRFLGVYSEWKRLREEFGLKWRQSVSAESAFLRLYSGKEDCEHTEAWMAEVQEKLDWEYWLPIVVGAVTGMRLAEVEIFLNKVAVDGIDSYPKSKIGDAVILEHFRVKDVNGKCPFLRGNKNLYISIVGATLLERLKEWKTLTSYCKLRSKLRRLKLSIEMKGLRKFYGSLLREKGIQSEAVDMLCGRIGQSVFVRSYDRYSIKKLVKRTEKVIEPYEQKWLSENVRAKP